MSDSSSRSSSGTEAVLMRAWMGRGLLACLLWPLSLVFGVVGVCRRFLYRAGIFGSQRLPVPVIVVGNIFIGGTGKTPLVIWLIEALRRKGFSPGVISRGYGSGADCVAVDSASDPKAAGDEPVLIAQRTGAPVVVGRKRALAGLRLLREHPRVNVIVADDGLQHYALVRDVEIALFDTRGLGNGWLLPAGPLREPASRKRDFTVFNAEGVPSAAVGPSFRMTLRGAVAESLADASRRMLLSELQARQQAKAPGAAPHVLAAAGIGNPARFFAMLADWGIVFDELPLPDHHAFDTGTFAGAQADVILITEKDAVKCRRIDALKNDPRIWVVPVAAEVDEALIDLIVEKLRGHPTA